YKLVIISITTFILLFMVSCETIKEDNAQNIVLSTDSKIILDQSESYLLFKNNCYACHSVLSKSHKELIAPPMEAIKRRYVMNYNNREEFIEAIVKWVQEPNEKSALMFGAVQQFKVMPKQEFIEEELFKIAAYIYDNEIEQPEWFQAHFNQQHNSKGRGKSMRGRR
ncbi:MAG: c-type cytochrome, partial [Flavobacteriaceae bacterium]|nr:c-type cytochrome [Flavobacteriaceae bacterium]